MKRHWFVYPLALGIGSLATASTVREHIVADLHKATPEAVASFSGDLSFALNSLRECPTKVQAQFDFGQRLVSVSYSDDRTQVQNASITASGHRPAPSFQPYQVTISVSSKVVKQTGPVAEDAPPKRVYECSVVQAQPPRR